MVWACFAGNIKGPLVIWDPDWGSINSESYCQHIVPLVHGFTDWLWDNYGIDALFMQDGAPSHNSEATTTELYDRDINIEDAWHPSMSPDLNPQENIWDWLKDDVSRQCGITNIPPSRHDLLRQYINNAWNRLPECYLESLVESMPARVAQVIEKEGEPTSY